VRKPTVVIVDLLLEDGNGLDLLDRVRSADGLASRIDPELPVVVLSGRQAQRGWDRARPDLPPTTLPRPPLAVLRCPHSSPRNLSTRPESRATILATYKEARRLAGL
jgi:CheY-like chemotaxis protein